MRQILRFNVFMIVEFLQAFGGGWLLEGGVATVCLAKPEAAASPAVCHKQRCRVNLLRAICPCGRQALILVARSSRLSLPKCGSLPKVPGKVPVWS